MNFITLRKLFIQATSLFLVEKDKEEKQLSPIEEEEHIQQEHVNMVNMGQAAKTEKYRPFINEIIVKKYPELTKLNQSTLSYERGLQIFYGLVQAGKTKTALLATYILFLKGYNIIYLTQNKNPHVVQFADRAISFNTTIKKELEEEFGWELPDLESAVFDINEIPRDDEVKNDIRRRKPDREQLSKNIESGRTVNAKIWSDFLNIGTNRNGIIILNSNAIRLELLNCFINEDHKNNNNIITIVDEADALFCDDKDKEMRKMNNFLLRLFEHSSKIIATTATPMKLFMDENQNNIQITCLQNNPNYVGVNDITFMTDKFTGVWNRNNLKCKENTYKIFDNIPIENLDLDEDEQTKAILHNSFRINIINFINLKNNQQPISTKIENRAIILPKIISIVISDVKQYQHQTFDYIRNEEFKKAMTCIMWNGDGLRLYSSALEDQPVIKIGKKTNMKKYQNYYHTNNKTVIISDLFSWIRDNGGYSRFGNIFVMTGKFSDRSVSFVCDKYIYHLSDMLYLPSKTTPISKMLQYLRICGIYKDKGDYTPFVYTNKKTAENICKGFEITEKVIEDYENEIINDNDNDNDDDNGCKKSMARFLDTYKLSGALKTQKKFFNVAPKSGKRNNFKASCFNMKSNDSINWSYRSLNKLINNLHKQNYSKYKGAKKEGQLKYKLFLKKVQEAMKIEEIKQVVENIGKMKIKELSEALEYYEGEKKVSSESKNNVSMDGWRTIIYEGLGKDSKKYYTKLIKFFTDESDGYGLGKEISKCKLIREVFNGEQTKTNAIWNWHSDKSKHWNNEKFGLKFKFDNENNIWIVKYEENIE